MKQKPTPKLKSRQYLLDALKREAFPLLAERGFAQLKIVNAGLIDFNRTVGQRVQCLTFQFDKYGLAKFKVLLAEGPLQGLGQYGGEYLPGHELRAYTCRGEKAILTECNKHFPLVRLGLLGWFSMPLGFFIGSERAAVKPVRKFIGVFEECEAWWESKTYGPHLFRDKTSELLQDILEKRHGKLDETGNQSHE
jgi:hypothetical protein